MRTVLLVGSESQVRLQTVVSTTVTTTNRRTTVTSARPTASVRMLLRQNSAPSTRATVTKATRDETARTVLPVRNKSTSVSDLRNA